MGDLGASDSLAFSGWISRSDSLKRTGCVSSFGSFIVFECVACVLTRFIALGD